MQIWISAAFLPYQIRDVLVLFLGNMLPSLQEVVCIVTEWKLVPLQLKGILLSLHIWGPAICYVKSTSALYSNIACTFSSLTFLYDKLLMAFFASCISSLQNRSTYSQFDSYSLSWVSYVPCCSISSVIKYFCMLFFWYLFSFVSSPISNILLSLVFQQRHGRKSRWELSATDDAK